MIIKNIIFTSGYSQQDDDLTSEKGHRSDILVEDDQGFFYELNFIDLNRLTVDFNSNIENGKNYFADVGLIILDTIVKDSIIKAVKVLDKEKYFTTQKKLTKERDSQWFIITI